jgi:hypothetical protein
VHRVINGMLVLMFPHGPQLVGGYRRRGASISDRPGLREAESSEARFGDVLFWRASLAVEAHGSEGREASSPGRVPTSLNCLLADSTTIALDERCSGRDRAATV